MTRSTKKTFTLKHEAPETQTNTKLNNPALFWLLCSALVCHSLVKSRVLISRLCLPWQGESLLKSNLPASLYVACFAHVSFRWHIKSYLFLSLACGPACFSLFSQHQLVRGAMSGQDATLTEGKRKWSHSSPTRSWKEMGNSEGKTLVCFPLYFRRWGGCVDASH